MNCIYRQKLKGISYEKSAQLVHRLVIITVFKEA